MKLLYLIWHTSGCDFTTVSSQEPVPSYDDGYPELTKYVPFSDVVLPQDVITVRTESLSFLKIDICICIWKFTISKRS